MASQNPTIVAEIPTVARVYSDDTVECLKKIQVVPATTAVGPVSSKDVVVSQNPFVAARLYLPNNLVDDERIPILVYFHGGGFFIESAFSNTYDSHMKEFVSHVRVMVVSVEYRHAPEHPLPAAYHDSWTALQWVVSHSSSSSSYIITTTHDHDTTNIDTDHRFDMKEIYNIYDTTSSPSFKLPETPTNKESWLINHGDLDRLLFIGGDSAGGNIVHNIAMRGGCEPLHIGSNVKIKGAIYSHPFFYGSEPLESLPEAWKGKDYYASTWHMAYPGAPGGVAPSLAGLGCRKALVCVAGKDNLRERGVRYHESVKKSGWEGKIEFYEEEEEDHVYHIHHPQSQNSRKMIKRLATFLLDE